MQLDRRNDICLIWIYRNDEANGPRPGCEAVRDMLFENFISCFNWLRSMMSTRIYASALGSALCICTVLRHNRTAWASGLGQLIESLTMQLDKSETMN